jgi:hypothetical protein
MALIVALFVLATGCGPDGPQRYRMSGKVTFEGRPVPTGMISFEPAEKGIGGGFAPIVNGAYDTERTGRGHLGGEHSVQITGFDGVMNPDDPDSSARPMFKPYTFTADLPEETTTRDFALPMDNAF